MINKIRRQVQKETIDAKKLNEVDEQNQENKIRQKKRKDDLEFEIELNKLMEAS